MKFMPFDRMWSEVDVQREHSDTDYFNSLMYFGEMVTKITVSALVAAVIDGRDLHQFRLRRKLVHADSLGSWSQVLDDVLGVVPAEQVMPSIQGDGNEVFQLTRRVRAGEWQYDSIELLHNCLKVADPSVQALPNRLKGKMWFARFAELRNRTLGHGATKSQYASLVADDLRKSISLMIDELKLYRRAWAYLHRSLNGKYRVTRWTEQAHVLDVLKGSEGKTYQFDNGVYISFGNQLNQTTVCPVELVFSDIDATDFAVPNGRWNGRRFQILSYITDDSRFVEATQYAAPESERPPSETQSLRNAIGDYGIHTIPNKPNGYILRPEYEERLYRELSEEGHRRIITLRGRGGIGKTWLTLQVLHRVYTDQIYEAILWFSARNIDLLTDGPKQVKPDVLNERDVAEEFYKHIAPFMLSAETLHDGNTDKVEFLRNQMHKCDIGPVLFVFDNFETVDSPVELYNWIESYLLPPNKALITTRFREFRADYPVELSGMSDLECEELIQVTARQLDIAHLITHSIRDNIINYSEGHPYVTKILLGQVRRDGTPFVPVRVLTDRDDILDTLFESSFDRLTPTARRVFLTLCNWKSLVAETAIKAVLLRPGNDQMSDLSDAVYELFNSSLIEKTESADEPNDPYWGVSAVARQFGLRKLSIDPSKIAIDADTRFLRFFGATQRTAVAQNIKSRLNRLFSEIERQVMLDTVSVEEIEPIVERIAKSQYPYAWRRLASIHRKLRDFGAQERALKRFLEFSESANDKLEVWSELANLYQQNGDHTKELFSRIQLAQLPNASRDNISYAVNRFNYIDRTGNYPFDEGEKDEIVSLLIELMESHFDKANATDCSRLGWLYMKSRQFDLALQAAKRGLSLDPANDPCLKLQDAALDALQKIG